MCFKKSILFYFHKTKMKLTKKLLSSSIQFKVSGWSTPNQKLLSVNFENILAEFFLEFN